MYFVYILQSERDLSYYVGSCQDLEQRIKRHNAGYEKFTSKKVPLKLVWSATKPTRSEALALERKIKNFKSRKRIEAFIAKYVGPEAR